MQNQIGFSNQPRRMPRIVLSLVLLLFAHYVGHLQAAVLSKTGDVLTAKIHKLRCIAIQIHLLLNIIGEKETQFVLSPRKPGLCCLHLPILSLSRESCGYDCYFFS